jgi:non-specific serine/threonine protein kinase
VNTPTVEIYDFKADSWSAGPPLPLALNHAMAAAHGQDVYVTGGYTAVVFGAVNTLFVLREGAWQPLAPMPETRAAGAMVTVGDRLYVIGGFSQQGELATSTLVYDIATESWTSTEGMPDPREHLTAVVHRGTVIVMGGRKGDPATNSAVVERFDPRRNRWSSLPEMLEPRSGHACALVANRFVGCIGGEDAMGVFSTAEVLDLRRERWMRLPTVDPGRTGLAAGSFGGRLYSAFGASDTEYLTATESIPVRR